MSTSSISDHNKVNLSSSPSSPLDREEKVTQLFRENLCNSFNIFFLGGLFIGLLWFLAAKGVTINSIASPLSLSLAGVGTGLWLAFLINSVKETSKHYKS